MVSEFGWPVIARDNTIVTEPSPLSAALCPLIEQRTSGPSAAPNVAMNWFHTTRFQNRQAGGRCVITSASSSSSTKLPYE